jgi:hypothetical protein
MAISNRSPPNRKTCTQHFHERQRDQAKKVSCSFLKKRTKRLLHLRRRQRPGHGLPVWQLRETKVFCFFSSEKKIFP